MLIYALAGCYIAVLAYAAYVDIKKGTIPDTVHVVLICVAMCLLFINEISFFNMLSAGVVFGLAFLIPTFLNYNSVGGGDIKLIFAASLCIGRTYSLYAVIIAFLAVGVGVVLTKQKNVRFAPYAALGYGLMFLVKYVFLTVI